MRSWRPGSPPRSTKQGQPKLKNPGLVLIPRNPKVIGSPKALVGDGGSNCKKTRRRWPGTVEVLVSRSLTKTFSSGGGI